MFAIDLTGEDGGLDGFTLVDSVGAGEPPPDFGDDEQTILAFESQLKDFHYLFDDMHNVKGMSQQLALEAHRLVPEMKDRYPIGYFTKEPTATLYTVALEELHEGVWALIGAAALAISALLWKFYRWITKASDGGSSGGATGSAPSTVAEAKKEGEAAVAAAEKDIEKHKEIAQLTEEVATKLPETLKDIDRQMSDLNREIAANKQQQAEVADAQKNTDDGNNKKATVTLGEGVGAMLDSLVPGRYESFINQSRSDFYDIMVGGEWTKTMLDIGRQVQGIDTIINAKVKTVETMLNGFFNQPNQSEDKIIERVWKDATTPTPIVIGKYRTLEELVEALNHSNKLKAVNTSKKKLDVMEAVARLNQLYSHSDFSHLLTLKLDGLKHLTAMNTVMVRLTTMSQDNEPNTHHGSSNNVRLGMAEKLEHAIHTLRRETMAMVSLLGHVQSFISSVKFFNANIQHYLVNAATAMNVGIKNKAKETNNPGMLKSMPDIKGLLSLSHQLATMCGAFGT
jgi:hypothetical protein